MKTRSWIAIAGAVVALVAIVAACADDPSIVPCRNIPAGGCPRIGNACSDVTCEALYICLADGTWKLDRSCPPHDDAGLDASNEASDAAGARDVDLDVQGASGGPGCSSLEPPDCPLATAATCPSATSCCGCEDLFVCRNGGWEIWGSCGDNGVLTPR
jgi:hypothetical protein